MGVSCSTGRGAVEEGARGWAGLPAGCEAALALVPPDRQVRQSAFKNNRRGSVSAEPTGAQPGGEGEPLKTSLKVAEVPKSEETRARILESLQGSLTLRELGDAEQAAVAGAMRERRVAPGEVVIREGEAGDNFYAIEEGTFVATTGGGEAVCTYEGRGCFGELALLHGCPRAATVAAGPGGGRLWALDRAAFRGILVGGAAARRLRREAILRGCEALADLTPAQVAAAADCLVAEGFAAGEAILTEGEGVGPEAKFYVLESGEVHAFRTVNGERRLVREFAAGDVFGEVALLTNAPRQADCVAVGKTLCLTLTRDAFGRLMGPAAVGGQLARRVEEYAHLNDTLAAPQDPASPTIKAVPAVPPVPPPAVPAVPTAAAALAGGGATGGEAAPPLPPPLAQAAAGKGSGGSRRRSDHRGVAAVEVQSFAVDSPSFAASEGAAVRFDGLAEEEGAQAAELASGGLLQ